MATTTPTPAEDMVTHLASNGLGTAGSTLFVDLEPPNLGNTLVAIVYNSSGFDPLRISARYDLPAVQFIIVGAIGAVRAAQQRAQAIKELLHAKQFSVGTTRYIGVYLQGDIVPLGFDKERRPRYSLNIVAKRTYV